MIIYKLQVRKGKGTKKSIVTVRPVAETGFCKKVRGCINKVTTYLLLGTLYILVLCQFSYPYKKTLAPT